MAGNYTVKKPPHPRWVRSRQVGVLIAVICLIGSVVIGGTTAARAGADTASYTSAQIGTTGSTPTFYQGGAWTMSWSYFCPIDVAAHFSVTVNQPAGSTISDVGPNELGGSGSGFDTYYDTGTFDLVVSSGCSWNITVGPASSAPAATPLTLTSGQVGDSGDTTSFFVAGPWTMAWSYTGQGTSPPGVPGSCMAGLPGNFIVDVQQPLGGFTSDIGPHELGTGGSGVDSYTNAGTFSLAILSECQWSITISSSGGSSAPAPAPPAPAPRVFAAWHLPQMGRGTGSLTIRGMCTPKATLSSTDR